MKEKIDLGSFRINMLFREHREPNFDKIHAGEG